jgi:hypothetical protein
MMHDLAMNQTKSFPLNSMRAMIAIDFSVLPSNKRFPPRLGVLLIGAEVCVGHAHAIPRQTSLRQVS